jgi:hypothetical protein
MSQGLKKFKEEISMLGYDLEILKAIPGGEPLPGIEYCGGWADHAQMGISVIGAYDFRLRRYHIFLKDNFQEFQALADQRLVIGFNSESFDDRVCACNGLLIRTKYDILREFYTAKGLNPYPEIFSDEYKGYGLDAIAKANLGLGKTGNGAQAPIDWQRGLRGKVIEYCLFDVHLTRLLLEKVLRGEPLVDPVTGTDVFLRHPRLVEPPLMSYREKIALLKKQGMMGKQIAEFIGRHPRAISAIIKGQEPSNPNVRKKLDQLFLQKTQGAIIL